MGSPASTISWCLAAMQMTLGALAISLEWEIAPLFFVLFSVNAVLAIVLDDSK